MNIKLSIITVNLNNKGGLYKTIESVIAQIYTNYEYIIIDGGSTDGSVELIKAYAKKITYWITEPDSGIYNAMNKGILKATGDYLQFLNSGDCFNNNGILSKIFEVKREADVIYGNMNSVDEKGSKLCKPFAEDQLTLTYFFNSTIPHPSAFIARKLFSGCLYDESYSIAADKKFFVEKIICQNCSLKYIDEIIVNFDKKGISSQPESRTKMKEENDRIFEQLFAPRIIKEHEFIDSNYSDILAITRINSNRISSFLFKVLKKLIQ